MITNIVDLSVLNTVANLLGVDVSKIKPVYDQMKVIRASFAPASVLGISKPCLLLGSYIRASTDMASAPALVETPKFLYGTDDTAFDIGYSRPVSSAYESELPVIFDNISFPVNGSVSKTFLVSFIRFDLL